MIQAKRLGHIVLNVRNAEKSRDFYTQTLGLKVAHENLERGAVFLSFGKEHHDLALFQQATGEPPAKTQPGLHHVAWRLDNFEELKAAYKELKRMGIPLDSTAEHNVTRSVYFFDPDGNRVELYCDMVENGFETMQTVGPKRARRLAPDAVPHDNRRMQPFPLYVARADGPYKWDVDGNRYVDYWMGHGALLLGHNPRQVADAVREQALRGTHYGACHEKEVEWGEWVCRLVPSAERVRFTASGTEATHMAVRLARAFTGKRHVVKFAGHFHGWHEGLEIGVRPPYEAEPEAGQLPEG